jgi:hypothetical protein
MKATDRQLIEAAEQRAAAWKAKHDAVLIGGVRTATKAIHRLKKKNDDKQKYVLAGEMLAKELEALPAEVELPAELRLALQRFKTTREELGYVKKPRPEAKPAE